MSMRRKMGRMRRKADEVEEQNGEDEDEKEIALLGICLSWVESV